MRTLLLDIEGTTTPISFVYEVLFPYAAGRQRAYLVEHAGSPDVLEAVNALAEDSRREREHGRPCPPVDADGTQAERAEQAADVVDWLMERDIKATGLKHLQGLLWKGGYLDGSIKGALFSDVPAWLRTWRERSVPMAIYSSGSVAAQKLLFGYSEAGDLTPCFHAYFDTTIGNKKVASSYEAIAAELDVLAGDILFCTDNIDEARAADAANLKVAMSIRPGNAALPEHKWDEIRTFDELDRLIRAT